MRLHPPRPSKSAARRNDQTTHASFLELLDSERVAQATLVQYTRHSAVYYR